MSKYNHYLVEITEPTSSDETLRVCVMIENGHNVYYSGDQAEAVLDILKGKCQMMTDSAIRETLRARDAMINVLTQQNKSLSVRLIENNDEVCRLVGDVDRYKNDIVELKQAKENQKNTIREYREERDNLQRKCENQKKTIVEQLEIIETLKEKNAELIKENRDLERAHENDVVLGAYSERDLDMYREANEELTKKVDVLLNENEKLKLSNKVLRAEVKDDLKRRNSLANLNFELEKLRDEIEEKDRLISHYKAQYAKEHSYYVFQTNKNNGLQEMYNAQCKVVKDQAAKIDILDEEIRNLKQYNEWLRHNGFEDIAVYSGTIGEKVKYAVDNMKLRHENKRLTDEIDRLKESWIKAGKHVEDLDDYFKSVIYR